MRPFEHFSIVIVPLLGYSLIRYLRLPKGRTVLLVLFATQLPDLIDKPLSWTFGLLPSGRMLAHSLVVSVPVLCLLCLLGFYWGVGRSALLFTGAYLSHLAADFYPILWLQKEYYFYPNLFWPVLRANPDYNRSFAAHLPATDSQLILTVAGGGIVVGYAVIDITWRWRLARG